MRLLSIPLSIVPWVGRQELTSPLGPHAAAWHLGACVQFPGRFSSFGLCICWQTDGASLGSAPAQDAPGFGVPVPVNTVTASPSLSQEMLTFTSSLHFL